MVGRQHDGVSGRAFGAERGQRAARGPDGVELVNLNYLFGPACFLHDATPLPGLAGRFYCRRYQPTPIIGELFANRADVSSGCSKKSFGFS